MDIEEKDVGYIAGTPFVGAEVRMKAGPGDGHRGEFTAWDINAEKKVWGINEKFPVWSGALATAVNVVFYGTMDGWFKAVDAKTGAPLWQFKTSSGIIGQPTTWRGPDNKQYVSVLSGVGGWAGALVAGDLDKRDGTAAQIFRTRQPREARSMFSHFLSCFVAAVSAITFTAFASSRRHRALVPFAPGRQKPVADQSL